MTLLESASFSHLRPKAILGASIPRSGHHYLQSLLSGYYGPELYYCEVYTQVGCCGRIPCDRIGRHGITFQKSHDRDFGLRPDLSDALYIIQYREPVPEALSDRELDVVDHLGRKSLNFRLSQDHYSWWLAHKAVYYRSFHEKWFVNRLANAIYLDYESLCRDPGLVVAMIAERLSSNVNERRLAAAIEKASHSRAGTVPRGGTGGAFTPRVIEESPHFNRDLLGAFEDYVLKRCPEYHFNQRLTGYYSEHPLLGLILLADMSEPLPAGQTDRLAAAATLAPGHVQVLLRLARRQLENGNETQGISLIEDILERNPYFAPAYRLLIATAAKAERPVLRRWLDGNAIAACMDNAGALLDLARAFHAGGMSTNAIAALSVAVVLAPDSFRANHFLAKLLAEERRWSQAESYAEKARALKPKSKPNLQLLSSIRGQPSRRSVTRLPVQAEDEE